MRFWDSSALVPLFVVEPSSRACRALVRSDPGVAAWYGTRAEVVSVAWKDQEVVDHRESEPLVEGHVRQSAHRVLGDRRSIDGLRERQERGLSTRKSSIALIVARRRGPPRDLRRLAAMLRRPVRVPSGARTSRTRSAGRRSAA